MADKRCPCCGIVVIPRNRALCPYCFPIVPLEMRADFIKAYHLRVQKPARYGEELARLLLWRRWRRESAAENDQQMGKGEK